MDRIVLFSPVGGTDPISISNMQDGSMLHICRYYKPDVIYLYMTGEIIENHYKDDRYERSIRKLADEQDREIEVHRIERPDLRDVQEFDFFFYEYKKILFDLQRDLDGTDTLLVNVSSGTPAMKSGLLVLITLGEIKCKAIQVTTPVKAMNEHTHRDFDLDLLWELNPDHKNGINRCTEVQCPTLSKIQKEEIIKKHILVYDYSAAVSVADSMLKEDTASYYKLLQIASAREALDNVRLGKLYPVNEDKLFPVWSSDERKLFEYALVVDIKRRRGEYADFMRSFTPLFVALLEKAIKHDGKFFVENYVMTKKNGIEVWDMKKLAENKELFVFLNTQFCGDFKGGVVGSEHLCKILEFFSDNSDLIDIVNRLREIERKIRNSAAHQITSVTDENIKDETGFTAKQIMDMIRRVFTSTGIIVKQSYWDSYDDMNRYIIKKMDDHL